MRNNPPDKKRALYLFCIIVTLLISGIFIFIKPLSDMLFELSGAARDLKAVVTEEADGSTSIIIYSPFLMEYVIIPLVITALLCIDFRLFSAASGIKIRARNKFIVSFTVFLYTAVLFYPSLTGIFMPLISNSKIVFCTVLLVLALLLIASVLIVINWIIKFIRLAGNGGGRPALPAR
jgi:hypothetical protein